MRFRVLALPVVFVAGSALASAQEPAAPSPALPAEKPPVTLDIRSFIYADNTEFLDNPFRDGETLIGEQVRAELVFPLSSSARFLGGFHSNSIAGDAKAFEKFRPVVALELDSAFGTFTLGTIRSGQMGRDVTTGLWPEESGPHGLVPALQVDTLSMTRSYEAGLQVKKVRGALQHDGWLAWQKLNTPEQRERIDAGLNARAQVFARGPATVRGLAQLHVVHEGGQLYDVGTVGDSVAAGLGAGVDLAVPGGTLRVEGLRLQSKHDPDRDTPASRVDGSGTFAKVAYDFGQWHGVFLAFTGNDFVKWEGDPNYGARTLTGAHVPERTYKEMSVSRKVALGSAANLVANLRFYKVDGDWDYAYRIVAAIKLSQPLRRRAVRP